MHPPPGKRALWKVHPAQPNGRWGSWLTRTRMNVLFSWPSEEQKPLSLIEWKWNIFREAGLFVEVPGNLSQWSPWRWPFIQLLRRWNSELRTDLLFGLLTLSTLPVSYMRCTMNESSFFCGPMSCMLYSIFSEGLRITSDNASGFLTKSRPVLPWGIEREKGALKRWWQQEHFVRQFTSTTKHRRKNTLEHTTNWALLFWLD